MVTRQPASVARSLLRSSCQILLAKLTVLSRPTTRSCWNDSLVLDGKDQVEISAPQRHKGSSALTGGNAEALIELFDVLIAQKAVGFLQNGDASRSQFLRQPSLPSAEPALATSPRLR